LPALRFSIRTSAALRAGTPKGEAAGPERKVTMPILRAAGAPGTAGVGVGGAAVGVGPAGAGVGLGAGAAVGVGGAGGGVGVGVAAGAHAPIRKARITPLRNQRLGHMVPLLSSELHKAGWALS